MWIINSGSTKYITPNLDNMVDYKKLESNEPVSLDSGENCKAAVIFRRNPQW